MLRRLTSVAPLIMLLMALLALPTFVAAQDATEEPVMEEVATEEAMEQVATEEPVMEEVATEEAATEESEADESEEAPSTATVSINSTDCPTVENSVEYRVQPGDTLSSIARSNNVSAVCLARFNDIVNPSLIFWGSVIDVPTDEADATGGPTGPNETENELTTYTVRQGDNLYRISLRFDTSVARLQTLNPTVANPNVIFVGQELIVPAS